MWPALQREGYPQEALPGVCTHQCVLWMCWWSGPTSWNPPSDSHSPADLTGGKAAHRVVRTQPRERSFRCSLGEL
jgi:hypothetical protein